jgi:AcrR family transcriptional regulator
MNALNISVSAKLYNKNPEETDLGKRILSKSIELMEEMGYEHVTFKKIGLSLESTEASVYRYFQNKHQLLAYLINWYWGWLEVKMAQEFMMLNSAEDKLKRAVELLVLPMDEDERIPHIDEGTLQRLVVAEYPKIYLTKEVDAENEEGYFLGYKRICDTLGSLALQINPDYKYPHSLFSTVISAAQSQQFFTEHLPRLSDAATGRKAIIEFLTEMTLNSIQKR